MKVSRSRSGGPLYLIEATIMRIRNFQGARGENDSVSFRFGDQKLKFDLDGVSVFPLGWSGKRGLVWNRKEKVMTPFVEDLLST